MPWYINQNDIFYNSSTLREFRYRATNQKGGEMLKMLQNIETGELAIIAMIMLVLFGGKKLPELSRGLAQSIKEFKTAVKE